MRYLNSPKFNFTDANGKMYSLYQMREIPNYQISAVIPKLEQEEFDEIFTRPDIAGDNMEGAVFQLHEANHQAILDAKFDYSKLRSIKVPVVNDLG